MSKLDRDGQMDVLLDAIQSSLYNYWYSEETIKAVTDALQRLGSIETIKDAISYQD